MKTAAAEPTVAQKRAQAQSVLAQIQEIDGRLGATVEAWNGANVRLAKIRSELQTNTKRLGIARTSLQATQEHLAERLVALYVSGGDASAVEVLLGAASLDDLLSRLDAVERVTEQDARVLKQVKAFKAEVQQRKKKLEQAQKAQQREVAELAAKRASIEAQLAERQRLYTSIKDQIASLEAAEARRQARLQAEARRLAALAVQRSQQAQASEPVAAASPAAGSPAAPAPQPGDTASAPEQPTGAASSPEQPAAAAPAARYGGVVGIAMQYLGVPYKWGGESPSTGFDCSGFTKYVFGKLGVSLPHYTGSQWQMGSAVSKGDLQAGDLVFFNGLGHMGIYVGGGNFIHAPRTGDVVKISSLSQDWYMRSYMGARRL